jgi:hypothetical protein
MKCEFCEQILKDIQILNFMKIPLVEGKLCCGDGLTDRHEVANSRLLLRHIRMERVGGKRQNRE